MKAVIAPIASRRRFISQACLGLTGIGLLAACDRNIGSFSPALRPSGQSAPLFADTPRMQALLQRNGLLAIREHGVGIVRDDMKSNVAFVKRVTRPAMISCGCSGGGGSSDGGFSVEYDGVSIGGVSAVVGLGFEAFSANYSYMNSQEQFDEFMWALDAVNDGGYCYGPIYTVPTPISCAEQLFGSVSSAMKQLAIFIGSVAASAARYGITNGVLSSANGFLTGSVSLEGFLDVLLAVFSFSALSEILIDAGIGIAISLLVEYLWCLG
jgi:hypothetical protein